VEALKTAAGQLQGWLVSSKQSYSINSATVLFEARTLPPHIVLPVGCTASLCCSPVLAVVQAPHRQVLASKALQ
jgi:hypothetical protein